MHCEYLSAASLRASLTPAFGAAPVTSFRHVLIADLNAGELTSIVDGRTIPKTVLAGPDGATPPGSGNLGTPCERMHLANASCPELLEFPLAAERLGLLPDPHAAIATAQVTAASVISTLKPFRLTIASVVADAWLRARNALTLVLGSVSGGAIPRAT